MMIFRNSFRFQLCAAATAGLLAITLSGCGVDYSAQPSPVAVSGLKGIAHGGPNPVSGATVTLYATSSGGSFAGTAPFAYTPAAPTVLGTTTTDASGGFNFTSALPCTAGQQAYITAYGGNPGSGTNPNYLLLAALGPCSTISASTVIWVDEVTTVAAAYALRPFMLATTDTSNNPLVEIGAPANNNAGTGACTTVSNVTTGCTAAGLAHAFENALNLANSVSVNGTNPNGAAYAVTPSNPAGVVPQALVNTLADAVEVCVNSTGGATGDSNPCGNLFSYTTAGGTVPTTTLQAMMNIAQYPALTPANVINLFNSNVPVSYYQPQLTAAPHDYSIAIAYSGVSPSSLSSGVTALSLTNINASGYGSGDAYTSVPSVIISAPGGTGTTATATASLGLVYFNVTGGACTSGTQNVVIAGGGGTGATATATIAGTGTGAATGGTVTASGSGYTSLPTFTVANCSVQPSAAQKVKGLGVVALTVTSPGSGYTSAPTITISAPPTSTTPPSATATATATTGSVPFNAPYALTLDANDNVYVGSQNILGTAGANSYLSGMSSNGSSMFSSTPSTTYTAPRGAATDTLGNIWVAQNNTAAIQGFTLNGAPAANSVLTTSAAPFGLAVDKSNNVWYGTATAGAQNLFELPQASYGATTFTNPPIFANAVRTIAFDSDQNAYVSGFAATVSNSAGVFPNSGTVAAPAYAGSAIAAAPALTGNSGAGIALDSSNNAWTPDSAGLFEITPTFATLPSVAVTAFTTSGSSPLADGTTTPNYDQVDGSGNVWIADNQNQSIVQYVPGSGASSFSPCYVASGATTCAAALSQPQRLQVDSTGSVWITSLSNRRIYQLIGTGTPTWPQLSLGAPGAPPQ